MLHDVLYLALLVFAAWAGWHRPEREERRPGMLERRPDSTAGRRWGTHPTVGEGRRLYLSIRRARGLTGHGWLPRRPRL